VPCCLFFGAKGHPSPLWEEKGSTRSPVLVRDVGSVRTKLINTVVNHFILKHRTWFYYFIWFLFIRLIRSETFTDKSSEKDLLLSLRGSRMDNRSLSSSRLVRRGVRRIVRCGPAPGRDVPGGSGDAVRGTGIPDERNRPLRNDGTDAGAHAGSGRVPHAGGGTAIAVGKGDREGVPRGADDRRPRLRAPGRAPPRRRSPPVPLVGIRDPGRISVNDDAPHFERRAGGVPPNESLRM